MTKKILKENQKMNYSEIEGKKVYVSGPMTGIKDFNYPAFECAELFFKNLGAVVYSPHKAPCFKSWEDYMRYDIKMLCDCEYIFMLEGWENSKGAKIEKYIAESIGIKTIYHDSIKVNL
jgi:hypothetical protein